MNLLTPGIILYSFYLSTCMDPSDSDSDEDGSMLPRHKKSDMFEGGLGSSFSGPYTKKDLDDKFPGLKSGKGPKGKGPEKPKTAPGPRKDPMMPTDQEAGGASGGQGVYPYPQGQPGPYQPGQGGYPYPQGQPGPYQPGQGGYPYPQGHPGPYGTQTPGGYPPQPGPYGTPGPYGQPGQYPTQTPGGYGQPPYGQPRQDPAYPPDPYAQGPAYPPTGPAGAEGYGGGASGGSGGPGQPTGPPGPSSGPATEAADGTKLITVDGKNAKNNPNVIVEEFRQGPLDRLHRQITPKPGFGFNTVKYDGGLVWVMEGGNYGIKVLLFPLRFSEKTILITLKDGSTKTYEKTSGKKWQEKD